MKGERYELKTLLNIEALAHETQHLHRGHMQLKIIAEREAISRSR